MKQTIIFATGNEGKMREIRQILEGMDVELLSMKEAGIEADIVEDGKNFEENAIIKANAVAAKTNHIVLADDSGGNRLSEQRAGHLFGTVSGRRYIL